LLAELHARYPGAVEVSALTGIGLDSLLGAVERVLESEMVHVDLTIPYSAGDLVASAHESGRIETEVHTETGTRITGWLPTAKAARIASAIEQSPADRA
jgi:GTP-binding protein HflX